MSAVDLTMPQLGESVAEGTVSRWLVDPGTSVLAEQPVLEVSTDKVDTEVVAPVSGVLATIAVPEGETVPVGTVLASIAVSAPAEPSSMPDAGSAEGLVAAPTAAVPLPATGPALPRGHRHRHSPRVRRLAREYSVDLDRLRATGTNGRATPADVLLMAQDPTQPASSRSSMPGRAADGDRSSMPRSALRGRVERLSRRRRLIAERMHRSLQESAQLTTVVEVDLTHVVLAREAVKGAFTQMYGVSLSVLPFVAESAVRALAEHPIIHAELDLDAGTVTYPSEVGLGVAVDTDEGLVVPVVRGADDLTVGGLARRIADLAARSRDGSATADDYAGGTFTITNTGSRGALFDTPILNAPQVAILGLGTVVRRPVVLAGEAGDELIGVRSMAYLSLTYDHRIIDGADAARYLTTVKRRVEAPIRSWVDAAGVKVMA